MKLNEEQTQLMNDIVNEYNSLENRMNTIEKELQLLNDSKNLIMTDLENAKSREKEFFEQLEKFYGKGKLDLFSMEYVKEKN